MKQLPQFVFCCCQSSDDNLEVVNNENIPDVVFPVISVSPEGRSHVSCDNDQDNVVVVSMPSSEQVGPRLLPPGRHSVQTEFLVSIVKQQGQKFGFYVADCFQKHLVVTLIKDGMMTDWNETHPDSKVEVGDIIISVNSKTGNCKEMKDELVLADKLDMVLIKTTELPDNGTSLRYDLGKPFIY